MRTFVEKHKGTRQIESATPAKPGRLFSRRSPEVSSILHLQKTIGNQAVQRLLRSNVEEFKAGLAANMSSRFAHNYSCFPVVRRVLPPEEEEGLMKPDIQRVGLEGGKVPPKVESAIKRARGGGQPLDSAVQAQMSNVLGYDFSGVRVHTDAAALNQQLSARAFTTGRDIFFKRGEYNPGTSSGRELIAHELSHVMQQSTGRVRGGGSGMTVRPARDPLERKAETQASEAAAASGVAGAKGGRRKRRRQGHKDSWAPLESAPVWWGPRVRLDRNLGPGTWGATNIVQRTTFAQVCGGLDQEKVRRYCNGITGQVVTAAGIHEKVKGYVGINARYYPGATRGVEQAVGGGPKLFNCESVSQLLELCYLSKNDGSHVISHQVQVQENSNVLSVIGLVSPFTNLKPNVTDATVSPGAHRFFFPSHTVASIEGTHYDLTVGTVRPSAETWEGDVTGGEPERMWHIDDREGTLTKVGMEEGVSQWRMTNS